MLSPVGQQKLQSLVQTQGRPAVENLVKQGDAAALEKVGFTKLDALALLDTAKNAGIDAAFKLADAAKVFGGVQNSSAGGAKAVADFAGQKAAGGGGLSPMAAVKGMKAAEQTHKNYGALLGDTGVVSHAASLTHNIWLEGGNKPGIRLVKDKDGNPDVLTSMKKSGVDWSRHGIDLSKISAEEGKAFLAQNGIDLGGSNRTFAFKADGALRPVPANAAEQKLLDFIGADVVAKQMKGNNEAAILGVAKPLANVLSGVKPTFISADAGYLDAAKAVYAQPASASSAAVKKSEVQQLLTEVKAYAEALGKDGADLAAIGKQFPTAHAVAGAVHDDFTGYRKSNDVYMDDSQVVPYEKLSAGIAKLDCDPIIATLTASLAALEK